MAAIQIRPWSARTATTLWPMSARRQRHRSSSNEQRSVAMVVPLDRYRRDELVSSCCCDSESSIQGRAHERGVRACDRCGLATDWASPIEALPMILVTPARFTSVLANAGPGQWSQTRPPRRVDAATSRGCRGGSSRHRDPAAARLRTGANRNHTGTRRTQHRRKR